ncbi:MAG TPA: glycogen debranching N-terminal domain-containing protein [Dehalococcoidia bacterium]|nr:glycogen debranching N-terminal domain-containing protein [Dehalococcoidia bacterium]
MPVEISVGPPALTINQGSQFMVTELDGQIASDSQEGLFADDTRFVSYYEISANGQRWERLTSATPTYYAARIYLRNQRFSTEDGLIEQGTLGLVVTRTVAHGVHEDLDITNFGRSLARFNLEIALRSDFADIFEVKSRAFVRRGHMVTRWNQRRRELTTSYANKDFRRRFTYRVINNDSKPEYANGRVTFEVAVEPGQTWHTCCLYVLADQSGVHEPVRVCYDASPISLDDLQREWEGSATKLLASNEDVNRLYRQSVEDIGALRLHEHDFSHDEWIPAAGVPWFVTIFGRDSIIVSLQNMMAHAGLAVGTLRKLAQLQARELDDWRDAQPGKIPHEIRSGELAHFARIPHSPYFGSADATPLYLILLHEAWKWLGRKKLLEDHRAVADGCLDWIDRYGDLDGDGFQEYQTKSVQGYENMGWKDSGDAIVDSTGMSVHQPKALCELQGYVFDAWMRWAEIFEVLGEPKRALELRAKAAVLQERFEATFWCEDKGFYALTLDPQKTPVPTIASNAGHCLWSGIASREHAARVVRRVFEPDMWSGWGVRTLSADNPAYNPFSYQRGSVWPHDNGILAMGFKRYGFHREAARVAQDVIGAASNFESYRLPELYAGVARAPGTFPVQYIGANVPQAWAAGSVFHLLQAMLGLQADAPRQRLYVDPCLPSWLPSLTLKDLMVGSARLDLDFWREADETHWRVTRQAGDIMVEQKEWTPW